MVDQVENRDNYNEVAFDYRRLKRSEWLSKYTYVDVAQAREILRKVEFTDNLNKALHATYYIVNSGNNSIKFTTYGPEDNLTLGTGTYRYLHSYGLVDREELNVVRADFVEFGDESVGVSIPNHDSVELVHKALNAKITQEDDSFYDLGEEFCLTRFIALFVPFRGFQDHYEHYIMDPDDGVVIKELKDIDTCKDVKASRQKGKATRNERKILAFCALLTTVKSMTNNKQHETVLIKRVGAASIELKDSNVSHAKISGPLSFEKAKQIYSKFAYFPKLRQLLFQILTERSSPLAAHCHLILSESQMSVYSLCHNFVFSDTKTAAHVDTRVLRDSMKFLANHAGLVERYGDNWKLYKLVESDGAATRNGQWPNLARASIAFAITYSGINHAGLRESLSLDKTIFKKVTKRIPNEYLFQVAGSELDEEDRKQLLSSMGIKPSFLQFMEFEEPDKASEDIYDEVKAHHNLLGMK